MLLVLNRYLLREILKSVLVTTGVLVTVIAFGAAIKPLANDRLLTAGQVAKYIVIAAVPMLQFALPFSAGFAATITFHRLTTENEILAAAASGISYRRMLRPIVAFGGVLLIVMLLLTQWTIPRFWGLMQAMIAEDVTIIFERAISRGEPFQVGRLQIYADDIVVVNDPPGSEADSRMVLIRGTAAELDADGRILTDVTFSQAVADLYRTEGRTVIKLAMRDTVAFNRRTSQLVRFEEVRPREPYEVGHVLEDDPMIMTFGELLEHRRDPDRFSTVRDTRDLLAAALVDAEIFELIDRRLRNVGEIDLVQSGPDDVRYLLRAGGLESSSFIAGAGGLELEEWLDGTLVRRYRPAEIRIGRTESPMFSTPAIDLVMAEPEVTDLRSGSTNRRAGLTLTGLDPSVAAPAGYAGWTSDRFLGHVAAMATPGPQVLARLAELEHRIETMQLEITSRLAERYAMSTTAPLLLLLGTTLAILKRESLPLTVYLWAFVPSILDLMMISGGRHMLQDGRPMGWVVLWGGNVILLGLLVHVFVRLSRH